MPKVSPLKQYLPFLVGQLFHTPNGYVVIDKIDCENRYKAWMTFCTKWNQTIIDRLGCVGKGFYLSEIKPVLRSIDSLTEKERKNAMIIFNKEANESFSDRLTTHYEGMIILLRMHVDIFGLIKRGLAVDIETIKKEVREKWLKK